MQSKPFRLAVGAGALLAVVSSSVAVAQAAQQGAAAAVVKYALTVKALDATGAPAAQEQVDLVNVDDRLRFKLSTRTDSNGLVRANVPKGNYSLIGEDGSFDEATGLVTLRLTSISDFKVTAARTVTLDHRKATVEPAVSVPKPAKNTIYSLSWRRDDALKMNALKKNYAVGPTTTRLLVAPAAAAGVGTARTTFLWTLVEPTAVPTYSYTVGARANGLPAKAKYTFAAKDLATVKSAYYGEGAANRSVLVRRYLQGESLGEAELLPRGSRRTEYVGFIGGKPKWQEELTVNPKTPEVELGLSGPSRVLAAGSSTSLNWLKGPLVAAVPVQSEGFYCAACRVGKILSFSAAPFTDSYLSHVAAEGGAESANRIRFYRDGKLVLDKKTSGGVFSVPTARTAYKILLDVDRRPAGANQSTQVQTAWTFSSSSTTGKQLASKWSCRSGQGKECRALPLVQARLALPLTLNGTLPAAKSAVTVSVAQIQNAATSAIKSAGLQIRPVGKSWTTVKLTAAGGGKYTGTIDNTELTGNVDVRITGADKAGSTFQQTVLKAYTVAG